MQDYDYRETLLRIEEARITGNKRLALSNHKLKALPPEIGLLTNLISLLLGFNQLSSPLPEISQLTNLGILNLSGNHLSSLPPEIGLLPKLAHFSVVDGNHLLGLPHEVVKAGDDAVLAWLRQQVRR